MKLALPALILLAGAVEPAFGAAEPYAQRAAGRAEVQTRRPRLSPDHLGKNQNCLISVRDFGATGDGKTDDTDALMAAFNEGIRSGRAVHIPSGLYRHTGLSIRGSITLIGDGRTASILLNSAPTSSLALIGATGALVQSVRIERLGIHGGSIGLCGLEVRNVTRSSFDDVEVSGHKLDGMNIESSWILEFVSCYSRSNGRDGYRLGKPPGSGPATPQNAIKIIGGEIHGNIGRGVYATAGENIFISTTIEGNGQEGVVLAGVLKGTIADSYFEENGTSSNADTIRVSPSEKAPGLASTIRDNFIFGKSPSNPAGPHVGHGIYLDGNENAIVEGNLLAGYLDVGLKISASTRAAYVGNNYCSPSIRECRRIPVRPQRSHLGQLLRCQDWLMCQEPEPNRVCPTLLPLIAGICTGV